MLTAVALAAAAWASAGAAAEPELWEVTGVANAPDMAVTALVDDDPAYLGAVLTLSEAAIEWDTAATNGTGQYDVCLQPVFTGQSDGPDEVAVTCLGAPWGPGATLDVQAANRMVLDWYDGGRLTLTRRAGP